MNKQILLLSFIVCASFSAGSLLVTAQATPPETAIITDPEGGVVRIMVKGVEVVRFDASGLHVRDTIHYGGRLVDYSEDGYDAHAATGGEVQDTP